MSHDPARPELATLLLNYGADPNRRFIRHQTSPLIVAIEKDNADLLALVIDRGADLNADEGKPLVAAARRPTSAAFDRLISRGASLSLVTGPGETVADGVLRAAAESGQRSTARTALDNGAHPNQGEYMTPLTSSVLYGHAEIAEMLLAGGADPNIGRIDYATLGSLARGGKLKSRAIRDLIQTGWGTGGVPYPSDTGGTIVLRPLSDEVAPLSVAIAQRDEALARLLLDHGADPNRLALGRVSPLYLAAIDCNRPMAQLLVDRGATGASPPALSIGSAACAELRPVLPEN